MLPNPTRLTRRVSNCKLTAGRTVLRLDSFLSMHRFLLWYSLPEFPSSCVCFWWKKKLIIKTLTSSSHPAGCRRKGRPGALGSGRWAWSWFRRRCRDPKGSGSCALLQTGGSWASQASQRANSGSSGLPYRRRRGMQPQAPLLRWTQPRQPRDSPLSILVVSELCGYLTLRRYHTERYLKKNVKVRGNVTVCVNDTTLNPKGFPGI